MLKRAYLMLRGVFLRVKPGDTLALMPVEVPPLA
jgi:hypothetical protein